MADVMEQHLSQRCPVCRAGYCAECNVSCECRRHKGQGGSETKPCSLASRCSHPVCRAFRRA